MVSPVKIWRNQEKIRSYLGKTARIVSWTQVYVSPAGFEDSAPYVVALCECQDGSRRVAQLVDWEEKHLKRGQVVLSVLRRLRQPEQESVIRYGVKWKPIEKYHV